MLYFLGLLFLIAAVAALIKPSAFPTLSKDKKKRLTQTLSVAMLGIFLMVVHSVFTSDSDDQATSKPSPKSNIKTDDIAPIQEDQKAMFLAWCEETDRRTNIIREADAKFGYTPEAGIPIGEIVTVKKDTWSETVKIQAGTNIKIIDRQMVDKMHCMYKVQVIGSGSTLEVSSSVLHWYDTKETQKAWDDRRMPWVEAKQRELRDELQARGFSSRELLQASIDGDWAQRYRVGECAKY